MSQTSLTQDSNKFFCIVTKSGSGPMALVRKNGEFQLPLVTLPTRSWPPSESAEINGQLMDHHGLNCTFLRWLERQDDFSILVMEWHPGSPTPEVDVEWVDPFRDDLPLPEKFQQMVATWRRSTNGRLAPWENPGLG